MGNEVSVSPLATLRDKLRQIERGMQHSDYDPVEVCASQRQLAREALAVLDSLNCDAISSDGERCKYKLSHISTGQPHSWTLMGLGVPYGTSS